LRFHRVAVDSAQIARQFAGSAIGAPEMLRCAKELKVEEGLRHQPAMAAQEAIPGPVMSATGGAIEIYGRWGETSITYNHSCDSLKGVPEASIYGLT
jgi:ATP-binding cassette, subfamily B, bacterial HlyB/CyaB